MPDTTVLRRPEPDTTADAATSARHDVVTAWRVRVPVDRRPVDPRLDGGRRVQRVDEPDPADARLGVGAALDVVAGGRGDPAAAGAQQAAGRRRPGAGERRQLVGERRGVAAGVVRPTGVQQGAQSRPDCGCSVPVLRPADVPVSKPRDRSCDRNLRLGLGLGDANAEILVFISTRRSNCRSRGVNMVTVARGVEGSVSFNATVLNVVHRSRAPIVCLHEVFDALRVDQISTNALPEDERTMSALVPASSTGVSGDTCSRTTERKVK